MRKLIFALIACGGFSASAFADHFDIDVTNKATDAIKTIMATPRAGGAAIALTGAQIAVGASSRMEFEGPASTCVFTLNSTLVSGQVITAADVFLCHTQTLVIQ